MDGAMPDDIGSGHIILILSQKGNLRRPARRVPAGTNDMTGYRGAVNWTGAKLKRLPRSRFTSRSPEAPAGCQIPVQAVKCQRGYAAAQLDGCRS